MNRALRNVLILLALAGIVYAVPGGHQGSLTVSNVLGVIFAGGFAFLAYRLYMEHRTTLFDLDENLRRVLYGSLAVAVWCLVATRRMWDAGGVSILLWFALCGAAAYGVFYVVIRWREY